MKNPLEKVLTVRISARDYEVLQAVADGRECSISAVIRDKIKEVRKEGEAHEHAQP